MTFFDGLALTTETPTRVIILSPADNKPIYAKDDIDKSSPSYIEVYSLDSVKANRLGYDAISTMQADRASGKVFTAEELDQREYQRLAQLTTGWRLISFSGEVINEPCTVEAAKAIYSDPRCAFIREQTQRGASDRARFTPAPQSA